LCECERAAAARTRVPVTTTRHSTSCKIDWTYASDGAQQYRTTRLSRSISTIWITGTEGAWIGLWYEKCWIVINSELPAEDSRCYERISRIEGVEVVSIIDNSLACVPDTVSIVIDELDFRVGLQSGTCRGSDPGNNWLNIRRTRIVYIVEVGVVYDGLALIPDIVVGIVKLEMRVSRKHLASRRVSGASYHGSGSES